MGSLTSIEIAVLVLSISTRFLRAIKVEARKRGREFSFVKYFSNHKFFLWVTHLVSCTLLILILPSINLLIIFLLKWFFKIEFNQSPELDVLIVALVGFAGYDVFKYAELILIKAHQAVIKKISK
jgi:hypothetical protein